MTEKKHTVLNFIRKNAYYIIIGASIIIITVALAIILAAANRRSAGSAVKQPAEQTAVVDNGDRDKDKEKPAEEKPVDEKPADPKNPDEDKPTATKIVFSDPVQNAAIEKDFTSSTVVFNKTLGVYTGHMGVDYSAAEGSDVKAAYGGTVESVTTSYLKGTTVTIDHGNGLKTVYNSIDADENLKAGMTVEKGQRIGSVSDNNRQEYKDGPHLHFEVTLNGVNVDPKTYFEE